MEIRIKYMCFHPKCNNIIEKLTITINIYENIYKLYIFQTKYNKFIKNKQQLSKYMEIHIKYMYFHPQCNNIIEQLTIIINIDEKLYKIYIF